MNPGELLRIDAAALAGGRDMGRAQTTAPDSGPVSILLARSARAVPACRVLALGSPGEVDHHPAGRLAPRMIRTDSILLPGLVNAHTHLDLSHVGPRPFESGAGFVGWVDMVRRERLVDEGAIVASVERGLAWSRQGGTVAIGDIAGAPAGRPTLAPFRALAASGFLGVSFVEFFGIGKTRIPRLESLVAILADDAFAVSPGAPVRAGLQPHAPNTVDRRLYRWAVERCAARGIPLSTHLAETLAEREFVACGKGPQREFLERLGLWTDDILDEVGHGLSPVEHLAATLAPARPVVAHVNDADDRDLERLAEHGISVAYCPRASAYFDAARTLGLHRYRRMLEVGVNVCLGTDSVINLPPDEVEARGMSVLDEMRLLSRRDGTPPAQLLEMATTRGARALGLDPDWFEPAPGRELAGLIAVRRGSGARGATLGEVLAGNEAPELIVGPTGWAA